MEPLFPHHLRAIPKVDLHRHLDCSMRWSTLVELAPQVGIELPSEHQLLRERFLITEQMRDLGSVLRKFLTAQKVLASREILTRLAFEACEDAYNDGVLLMELRYAPTFITEGHSHLDFHAIHESFLAGIKMATSRWPMAVGLICIIQRTKSLQEAELVCQFALEHADSFVGLDLADNEDGFEARPFADIFARAKKAGLRITIHAGESPGPQAAQRVREAVEILGAERIGHGVQVVHDPLVLDFVRERGVVLEVCPISNWLTRAFPRWADHPIRKLIASGVKITINSDDPGIFGTTLTDDYFVLHQVHGLGLEYFRQMNEVAAAASFISEGEKNRVWRVR
ncbi:MAG: adenosine deaminase [Bdellovibrionaceae bacterium]|nr:adenosine deaminase [Pseudobdellovibrionaceae bacterium]